MSRDRQHAKPGDDMTRARPVRCGVLVHNRAAIRADSPIHIDESGYPIPRDGDNPFVWTKTVTDGTFWPLNSTCGDWASTDGLTAGGDARAQSSSWSQAFFDSECSNQFRLYCLAQG